MGQDSDPDLNDGHVSGSLNCDTAADPIDDPFERQPIRGN